MKRYSFMIMTVFIASLLAVGLAGCGSTQTATSEKKEITVAVSPIFKDMANVIKKEFDKDGYVLHVKVFDDNVLPNVALQEGSVDINFFQHGIHLNQFNRNKGTDLAAYDEKGVITYFMGIFSKKVKSLHDIKEGDKVSIPNDPSNRGRALKMLASNGLITLKEGVEIPTKLDIIENPKNLDLIEMDVLKIVPYINDVQFGCVNSIIAVQGGLDPESALGLEDEKESQRYAIVVAVKKEQGSEKYAERFTKALETDAFKKFLKEKYSGAIVPLF